MRKSLLRRTALAGVGVVVLAGGITSTAEATENCVAGVVKRCVEIYWDQADDTFQARASITDVAGGGDYAVKVTRLEVLRTASTGPVDQLIPGHSAVDDDGWFWTEDSARGAKFDPCKVAGASYRAKAFFEWKGDATGSDWVYVRPHALNC